VERPGRKPDPRRKQAVALRYDRGTDEAPVVVASGQGLVAERIEAMAREAGVPTVENPALAAAIGQVEVGKEVPPVLYRAVAEVLAFVYQLDRKHRENRGGLK